MFARVLVMREQHFGFRFIGADVIRDLAGPDGAALIGCAHGKKVEDRAVVSLRLLKHSNHFIVIMVRRIRGRESHNDRLLFGRLCNLGLELPFDLFLFLRSGFNEHIIMPHFEDQRAGGGDE